MSYFIYEIMLIGPDEQEAAATLDILVEYMHERGTGKKSHNNLETYHLNGIFRDRVVWGILRYSF